MGNLLVNQWVGSFIQLLLFTGWMLDQYCNATAGFK